MIKRVLASVLSFLLIISSLSVSVFANPVGYPDNTAKETSEWLTNDELTVLYKLGITTWDTVKSMGNRMDEEVSRWYMAWYVDKLINLEVVEPEGFETLFNDLTSEHTYYEYIKAVYKAGIMNGDPDGTFRPNEPITTMEAARVLLRILGWDPYIAVAGVDKAFLKTNILDGVPITDKLTQPQILKMIYNALNSPAIRETAFETVKGSSELDVSYVIDDTYLGFEHLFGVIHEIGVLDGVYGTGIVAANTSLKQGQVGVAGRKYNYATDVSSLLGYKVNYLYYKADDATPDMMYLFKSDKNEEFVLTHNDIESYVNGRYKYTLNGGNNIKEIVLPHKIDIIYNDVVNPGFEVSEMWPKFGKVTLINNDNDAEYDVIKIDSYDFYYISKVDTVDMKIYDTESSDTTRIFDFKDADELSIISGGKNLAVNRLRAKNVAAVKRSGVNADYDKVFIEVLSAAPKGVKVTSINDKKITAGAVDYKPWAELSDVKLGISYDFFVLDGEVVFAIKSTSNGATYGYLIDLHSEGTFETTYKFAVADVEGNIDFFEGAKRIYIDGVASNNVEGVLNTSAQLSSGYDVGYPFAQPVKYILNTSGQLSKIYTLNSIALDDENAISDYVSATQAKYESYNTTFYDSTTSELLGSIDTGTTVLFVPMDDRLDEIYYNGTSLSRYSKYNIDIVERDEECMIPEVVYVHYSVSSVSVGDYDRASFICDLKEEINEDGDVECLVDMYQMGNLLSYTCDKQLFDTLAIGDVVRFTINKEGKILDLDMILDLDAERPGLGRRTWTGSVTDGTVHADINTSITTAIQALQSSRIVYGTVLNAAGSFITHTQSFTDDIGGFDQNARRDNFKIDSATVYKYTNKHTGPKVEKVGFGDIIPYSLEPDNASEVIISMAYGTVNNVYIIER